MLISVKDRFSLIILLFLFLHTPSVVLVLKQTVHRLASVAVTVEVEVVKGKKILGFLTLKIKTMKMMIIENNLPFIGNGKVDFYEKKYYQVNLQHFSLVADEE